MTALRAPRCLFRHLRSSHRNAVKTETTPPSEVARFHASMRARTERAREVRAVFARWG